MNDQSMNMDSLQLIHYLCDIYERILPESDDNAPEMVRVINAVASKSKVLICKNSEIGKILTSTFQESSPLWNYVMMENLPID